MFGHFDGVQNCDLQQSTRALRVLRLFSAPRPTPFVNLQAWPIKDSQRLGLAVFNFWANNGYMAKEFQDPSASDVLRWPNE